MKLSTFFFTLAAVIGIANAHNKFTRRSNKVADVVYADSEESFTYKKSYNFRECIPIPLKVEDRSTLLQKITFTQSATCYAFSAPDCSSSETPPVGIPIPGEVFALNLVDFAQLVGQAGMCYPNALPGIPLLKSSGSESSGSLSKPLGTI